MVIQTRRNFVPAGDVAALAGAIEKVIVDLSFARRLGGGGHQRALNFFDRQNVRALLALLDAGKSD